MPLKFHKVVRLIFSTAIYGTVIKFVIRFGDLSRKMKSLCTLTLRRNANESEYVIARLVRCNFNANSGFELARLRIVVHANGITATKI